MQLTEKEEEARRMVCLPLDNMKTLEQLEGRVKELSPVVGLFKIGFGSFTRFGLDSLRVVKEHGADAFLDLKFHDIPNTVCDAAKAATEHQVRIFNVHASGGAAMLDAAMKGAYEASQQYGVPRPTILGVTVLTSLDEARYLDTFKPANPALAKVDFKYYFDIKKDDEALQQEFASLLEAQGLTNVVQNQVLHLARMTHAAGLDGVICSAADLEGITDKLPPAFIYGTPGVKGPVVAAGSDQKRVMTPYNAVQDGSSFLVVGRAITGPKTPEERLEVGYAVLQDIAKAL